MTRTLDGLIGHPSEDDWDEEWPRLAGVLGDALHERYAGADPEELAEALDNVLDSMSAAEAASFTNALKQIERASGRLLADPAVGRIAGTALPLGGSALGTVIGGPAGTAIGSGLGQAAAKALAGAKPARPSGAASASGSAAAVQAMILSELGPIKDALLRVALGEHGQQAVNGIPVAKIMELMRSVYERAAADADELRYLARAEPADGEGLEDDSEDGGDQRWLYTALMDAANDEWDAS
ncbi:MAG TPA: hypothetical protein VGJ95_07700 [Pseudonocardiaceae bacterium]